LFADLYDLEAKRTKPKHFEMNEARTEAAAVGVGDIVLIGGGREGVGSAKVLAQEVELFNVTSETFLTRHAIEPREGIAATSTDNAKAVFVGGETIDGNASSTIDVFDAQTLQWHTLQLLTPRYEPAAVGVGSKVYVFGNRQFGNTPQVQATSVEVIDLSDNDPDNWSVVEE
jgi:hypothetical protein